MNFYIIFFFSSHKLSRIYLPNIIILCRFAQILQTIQSKILFVNQNMGFTKFTRDLLKVSYCTFTRYLSPLVESIVIPQT